MSDNTYTVEFDVDYQKCGNNPIVSVGGVDFGSAGDVRAGRACSKNGYKTSQRLKLTLIYHRWLKEKVLQVIG
jgi:hypothetical protein